MRNGNNIIETMTELFTSYLFSCAQVINYQEDKGTGKDTELPSSF